MPTFTITGIDVLCCHCGRPIIGVGMRGESGFYHEECVHGPGWTPQYFAPAPQPVCSCVAERALNELREAALPFLPPHSGLCVTVVDGKLGPVTRASCQCIAQEKRLRDALGAW